MQKNWFQTWFNSPFYHILYSQRNDAEAEFLIDNLVSFLKPKQGAKVLDIACGRGRHSVYLQKKGCEVVGFDLAAQSIKYAQETHNEKLDFFVHDMRKLFYINYFDISFNLFTSFGYFETEKDHVNALTSFRKGLKENGVLVIDYFNTHKIIKNLVNAEVKIMEGITFDINKSVIDGKIVKQIKFEHEGQKYNFEERVKAFLLPDFEKMLHLSGLKVDFTFGNYALDSFDANNSDRLILICSKI
ncbi:MAG: class I SAM-dependent methyltransferase [Sphingobacteriaceae bacterium]|nr:class I SAM-dependent methyltransferase [Sphingobacteriaceae bacterium]